MDLALSGQWLAVIIFFARIVDVTLGTLRTIMVVRGRVFLASLLGFIEVSIWIVVIAQVVKSLDNPWNMLGWAAGFAVGNAVGILVERRLAIGKLVLRVISQQQGEAIAAALRAAGQPVTVFAGSGLRGPVSLLYAVMDRGRVGIAKRLVLGVDPDAVLVSEDVRDYQHHLRPTAVPRTGWRAVFKKK